MSDRNVLASFEQHIFGTEGETSSRGGVLVRSSRVAKAVEEIAGELDPAGADGFGGVSLIESKMRMHRVAALRRAIVSGTYSVSAAELAETLMHAMQRGS